MENQYTDRFLRNLILAYYPSLVPETILIKRDGCNIRISGRDCEDSLVSFKLMDHGLEIRAMSKDLVLLGGIYLSKDFLIALRSLA